jgi:hypothetical protein
VINVTNRANVAMRLVTLKFLFTHNLGLSLFLMRYNLPAFKPKT